MSWISTFTGKKIYLLDSKSKDIDILDIAHSLSQQCRFMGHTSSFYSVAEHSLVCEQKARQLIRGNPEAERLTINLWLLAVLLHDAHEMAIGDISKPFKEVLKDMTDDPGDTVRDIGKSIQSAIHSALDLPQLPEFPQSYHDMLEEVDSRMLLTEGKHFGFDISDWEPAKHWEPYDGVGFASMSPQVARFQFLNRYNELIKPLKAAKERGEDVSVNSQAATANA